jgi:hypothetical protein
MALFFGQAVDIRPVLVMDVLHVAQPDIDEPDALLPQRGTDTATAVVADDHDVLDLQHIDGVLDDRQAVEIGMDDDIGDVAMDEHFARQQADDLVGRHARVGTADPQEFRGLDLGQLVEILGSTSCIWLAQARLKSNRCDRFSLRISSSDQFSRSRARNIVPSTGVW